MTLTKKAAPARAAEIKNTRRHDIPTRAAEQLDAEIERTALLLAKDRTDAEHACAVALLSEWRMAVRVMHEMAIEPKDFEGEDVRVIAAAAKATAIRQCDHWYFLAACRLALRHIHAWSEGEPVGGRMGFWSNEKLVHYGPQRMPEQQIIATFRNWLKICNAQSRLADFCHGWKP